MNDFDFRRAALAEIAESREVKKLAAGAALGIRDKARSNVQAIYPGTSRAQAIDVDGGTDAEGVYADVGYNKLHTGFVLFFSEVGTVKMSPRPHLRPAMESYAI